MILIIPQNSLTYQTGTLRDTSMSLEYSATVYMPSTGSAFIMAKRYVKTENVRAMYSYRSISRGFIQMNGTARISRSGEKTFRTLTT